MSRRIGLGFASGSLIRSNIVSPAVKPIWNAGWLIVVILGTAIDATSILSKPTTPMSLGTFRPYLFAALIFIACSLGVRLFFLTNLLQHWIRN